MNLKITSCIIILMFVLRTAYVTQLERTNVLRRQAHVNANSLTMANYALLVRKVISRILKQVSATRLLNVRRMEEKKIVVVMVFVNKLVRPLNVFVMLASLMMDINNVEGVLIVCFHSLTARPETSTFSNQA